MIVTNELHKLKALTKRYARSNRIAQHQALDLIAVELGFAHWNRVISASKKGWRANTEQMERVEAFVMRALPEVSFREGDPRTMRRRFAYLDRAEHGMIGEHVYRLQAVLHDVIIAGEGWSC